MDTSRRRLAARALGGQVRSGSSSSSPYHAERAAAPVRSRRLHYHWPRPRRKARSSVGRRWRFRQGVACGALLGMLGLAVQITATGAEVAPAVLGPASGVPRPGARPRVPDGVDGCRQDQPSGPTASPHRRVPGRDWAELFLPSSMRRRPFICDRRDDDLPRRRYSAASVGDARRRRARRPATTRGLFPSATICAPTMRFRLHPGRPATSVRPLRGRLPPGSSLPSGAPVAARCAMRTPRSARSTRVTEHRRAARRPAPAAPRSGDGQLLGHLGEIIRWAAWEMGSAGAHHPRCDWRKGVLSGCSRRTGGRFQARTRRVAPSGARDRQGRLPERGVPESFGV